MAESLGQAVLELRSDNSKLEAGLSKAEKSAKRISAAFGDVGKKLTTFVTAPLLGLGGVGLKAASDLNESFNAVNVIFEDSAQTILDWGKTAATQAGLAQTEFNQAATVLGAALKNAGMDLDDVADNTIDLTTRAADMASVFNTDVDQALGAIQAALRGEIDPIERFGVSMNAAAVEAKALELGLIDAGEEMTTQEQTAARLAVIMEQTSDVQGDFANTSDQLANKARIAKASLQNLAADVAQRLIPVADRLVTIVQGTVNWFGALDESSKDAVIRMAAIAAAIGPVTLAVAGLVKAFGIAVQAFRVMGAVLAGAWPWGIIIAAVVGLATIVIRNWETIRDTTVTIWNKIADIFVNLKDGLLNTAKAIGVGLAGRFVDAFERVGELFADFGEKIKESAAIIFDPRKWGEGGLSEIWADGITDAFDEGFDTAGTRLIDQSQDFGEEAKESFGAAFTGIGDLVGGAFTNVSEAVGNIKDRFGEMIGGLSSGVGDVQDLFQGLVESINEAGEAATDAAQDVEDVGKSAEKSEESVYELAEATRSFTQEGYQSAHVIEDANKQALDFGVSLEEVNQRMSELPADLFVDTFGALGASLMQGEKAWKNWGKAGMTIIADLLEALSRLALMQAAAAGASLFGLSQVGPLLAVAAAAAAAAGVIRAAAADMAQGGVVPPGYPDDTYPANLTSGEVVVPPGDLPGMMGGNISVTINGAVGGREEVAMWVHEGIERAQRRGAVR